MTTYDDALDPEALFAGHKQTGEPLSGHEVRAIVDAGLASQDDFDMTGGDLWTHRETFSDPDADEAPPATALEITAEQFVDWLTGRVDEWCREKGLTPHGEGEDLGDLYRELDADAAFTEIGVTLIPAHDEQTLFVVGAGASWLATTGIELGIESETIWLDPLGNLRLDVPLSELSDYRDRLRRVVDEITTVLGG